MNILVTHIFFILSITWSLAYMVVANNNIDETKKSGKSMTILVAMVMQRTRRGTSPNEAHPGLHLKPLDAAIGQVPAPYRPGGRPGQRIC
jgi:hypothetical protein